MKATTTRNPSLYEVKQLTRDWGLVGEEDTVLTIFLAFLGGGFILMTGLSSGGKNGVVNSAAFCTPGGGNASDPDDVVNTSEWTFSVPTSLSKTALFQQHEIVNSHPVHVHQDIASLQGEQHLEKLWKRHGEGQSMTHSWTQVMGQEREERSQTLHPPNCMILFLAEDNQQVDINDYPEVRNRALLLPIDDSSELTAKVNERQAEMEAGLVRPKVNEKRAAEIREYVGSIPMHMYGGSSRGGFLNPIAPAIDNQNPLPQMFTEARRDFPRLMDFMKSVTLFHFQDRLELAKKDFAPPGSSNMLTMFVTPADGWYAMRIFGEKMVLSALNLREKDFELLSILRDDMGSAYTADELMMAMRDRDYNVTDSDIRSSMDNMLYKGYVRKSQDSARVEYSASPFAAKAKRNVQLDWSEVVEDTRETVYEVLPTEYANVYEDDYLQGDGLLVTHPFTGETVNLLEETANELEQRVEEAEAREEETVFDESDDSDEPDGSGGNTQGTLV